MAKYISENDFDKVANFFGFDNVRRAKNGGTAIIIDAKNKIFNDLRENTLSYSLYLYDDGFRWRRNVSSWYGTNHYQLFRNGINYKRNDWGYYPTDYKFNAFATVEEALARFEKYVNNLNMAA